MTLFEYYKSFFNVGGSTPFFDISAEIKNKYYYMLLQRLSLKNDISMYLNMNTLEPHTISDILYSKYGLGVGSVPKYFWFKLGGDFDEFYNENKDRLLQLFNDGYFYKFKLNKFKDVKALLKKSRLWKKKQFKQHLQNIKINTEELLS